MILGMADLLIRNVPASALAAIEERAKQRGCSVEAEALNTLIRGAQPTGAGLVAWLKTVRQPSPNHVADVALFTAAIRESRDER
jgi:plasmid stability protein